MRATRIPIGLFVALLALTSCDGTTPHEPPPPATLLLEAVTPTTATGIVGEELDVAPVVLVRQGDGLPVEGIQVSFVVSGRGFVGSATAVTDAAGRATPGTWRLGWVAGPQTLTARAAGRSMVFTADAQPGLLQAVTPVSASGIVGQDLVLAPVVLVMQRDGLPVEGIQVSFMVSGTGFVGTATVMTDSAGLASPGAWRLGSRAGLQTLTVRAVGRVLVFTADAQPGPITSLAVIGGNDQRAAGGITLSEPLRVKATDDLGNVVANSAVTFAVVDGGGSLAPGTSITGSDGIAESRWTLGTTAGRQHVRAQTGAEATAQFTADAYCEPGQCSFELAYSMNGNILIFNGATGGTRQIMSDGLSSYPEWSPDGERIAFERGDANGGIFVMNSDGTGVTRVTGAGAGSPTWSPRGDALAFTDCTSQCGLYVQELSGGSAARQIAASGSYPAWSPDGSRIAFFSFHYDPGDDTQFYSLRLVNPDGSGVSEIGPVTPGSMDGATWSSDGTRIAFSMNGDIYVVNADGSGLTRLTTYASAYTPAWSPDGTRIAYDHYDQSGPAPGPRIMAIPAGGGEPVRLVVSGYHPSWRP